MLFSSSGYDDSMYRWGNVCVCDDCLCAQVGICLVVMTVCVDRWGYVWVW